MTIRLAAFVDDTWTVTQTTVAPSKSKSKLCLLYFRQNIIIHINTYIHIYILYIYINTTHSWYLGNQESWDTNQKHSKTIKQLPNWNNVNNTSPATSGNTSTWECGDSAGYPAPFDSLIFDGYNACCTGNVWVLAQIQSCSMLFTCKGIKSLHTVFKGNQLQHAKCDSTLCRNIYKPYQSGSLTGFIITFHTTNRNTFMEDCRPSLQELPTPQVQNYHP